MKHFIATKMKIKLNVKCYLKTILFVFVLTGKMTLLHDCSFMFCLSYTPLFLRCTHNAEIISNEVQYIYSSSHLSLVYLSICFVMWDNTTYSIIFNVLVAICNAV
jgi:hypothetical protein